MSATPSSLSILTPCRRLIVADELAVTEQLEFVDYNAERVEQEARENEDLLLVGMDFGND